MTQTQPTVGNCKTPRKLPEKDLRPLKALQRERSEILKVERFKVGKLIESTAVEKTEESALLLGQLITYDAMLVGATIILSNLPI